jgi:hypothetical protein
MSSDAGFQFGFTIVSLIVIYMVENILRRVRLALDILQRIESHLREIKEKPDR